MRMLTAVLVSLLASTVSAAQLHSSDVVPPPYAKIAHAASYASEAEYDRALKDHRFRLTRIGYPSDGLEVFAYLYAPAKPKGHYPVVVFNRGSYTWDAFAGEYLVLFNRLADAGFVVIAPMYRGSGGAEGKDELGGADLDDLMNVRDVIAALPYADASNVFLYGESRGAMMTYEAIGERFPMRAAAVYGGLTDLGTLTATDPRLAKMAAMVWPDYGTNAASINERRSAQKWAEKIDVPVLIMHGGADHDIPPAQSLALAMKLQELGKPYQLIVREGANHVLTQWAAGRDAAAIEWFRAHMTTAQ